jgi:hypothetical protein
MAYSRYDNRGIFTNADENYRKVFFKNRDVQQLVQYKSAIFSYPTNASIRSLRSITHLWSSTDKLYNLAHDYYNDSKMWWIIAWYNKKPTESHFKVGDVVYVPLPLQEALGMFEGSQ